MILSQGIGSSGSLLFFKDPNDRNFLKETEGIPHEEKGNISNQKTADRRLDIFGTRIIIDLHNELLAYGSGVYHFAQDRLRCQA